jgi:hypothetical protein
MTYKAHLVAGLLLVNWLVSGCTQWRHELGVPLKTIDLPQPEQSISLAQALDEYGPPHRVSATDSGFVLAWEYWRIREDSVGISLSPIGVDFLSADWGETRLEGEFLLLTFDRQHRLTSATRSHWDNSGGGGQAIQPFGIVSVVDTDDLLDDLPQHSWGNALLQPLPRALNAGSSPDSGQSGLEQRGTPTAVGERTLEMD